MWKPLVAPAVLILLVVLGLYAAYETTKPEPDRPDIGGVSRQP